MSGDESESTPATVASGVGAPLPQPRPKNLGVAGHAGDEDALNQPCRCNRFDAIDQSWRPRWPNAEPLAYAARRAKAAPSGTKSAAGNTSLGKSRRQADMFPPGWIVRISAR